MMADENVVAVNFHGFRASMVSALLREVVQRDASKEFNPCTELAQGDLGLEPRG